MSETSENIKKAWENIKNSNYSLSKLGNFFSNSGKSKRKIDNIKIEDIKKWLQNPSKYQGEILDLSDLLYAPEGIYKTLVNLTTNMATLDNYVQPDIFTMQKLQKEILDKSEDDIKKEIEGFQKDFNQIRKYIQDIDIKKTGRRIIESLVRYGAYCGFEKNDGGKPYLWDLPIKYVRLYSIVDGQYKVEFNFKYFDELMKDSELNSFAWDIYPSEFQLLYKAYKSNSEQKKNPEWQPLPHQKICCIKLSGDNDTFFLPLYSQLFTELFLLNDLIDEEIEVARDDKVKLVNIEFPHDAESGLPLVEPNVVQEWVKVVGDAVPETVCVTGSPYPLKEIPFKNIQEKKTELVEFGKSMAYMQAGANPLTIGGTSTNSSVGVTQNLIFIQSLVFTMLDKIQSWFNYRISSINSRKQYVFKLKIWKITWFNFNEEFEREYKLASIGGSLNVLASKAGHDADDYNATLEYENLIKSKDLWIPPKNMNQQAVDNEGGRSETNNPSDNTIVTRDKESNIRS